MTKIRRALSRVTASLGGRGRRPALFAQVLEELAIATFAIDRSRRIIIWNKACAELTSLPAGSMLGTGDYWKAFYRERRPCLADIVLDGTVAKSGGLYAESHAKGRREAGLAAENWFELPCGRQAYLVIDAYPILSPSGEFIAVVETLRDVTAEKVAAREAEEVRVKAAREEEIATAERQKAISIAGQGLARLAGKDLSCRLGDDVPQAFRALQSDFNAAVDQLAGALAGVTSACSQITSGAQEISLAAHDVAARAERQAHGLDDATTAFNRITELLTHTARDAGEAHVNVKDTIASAVRGEDIVGGAVTAMGAIERSSQEITEIISVIDEIAMQTSLLALNAGVEAARAGAAGKGFGVVASETRALALRSSEAARQIKSLVTEAQTRVSAGAGLVTDSGGAFREILGNVQAIEKAIARIAEKAAQQTAMLREIERTLETINDHTSQNAAVAQQTSAIGNAFTEAAFRLSRTVSQFKLPAQFASAKQARDGVPPKRAAS